MGDVDAVMGALSFLGKGAAVLLVPLVLLRRKEPARTIAWALTLVFLPYLGLVLYFLFGRDRVRARTKRVTDAQVRAGFDAVRAGDISLANRALEASDASPVERALFKVGTALTHSLTTSGNRVDVFTDGNDAYAAIGAAIDGARHHVHAQYYLVRDDATGAWFRERLIAASKRGVEVRLLCDAFGSFGIGARWMRPLRHSGAHVVRFLPIRSMLLEPVNLRNHRKIVVVDGQSAFTGGLNIGDEYRGRMRGIGEWKDLHLRLQGDAVTELQRIFLQDWAFATDELLDVNAYIERSVVEGSALVAVIPSGPDTHNEAIHRLFFGSIASATQQVLITTPYFVPDEPVLVALEYAAMRGVDVKIILPGHSNHRITRHAGRSFFDRLLESGVHIFEYEPGMIHAKLLLADGRVGLVGSANMDLRSFRLNFEVHTLIHDDDTARALQAVFGSYLARSRKIELEEWRTRSWPLRFCEGAARLASPLL